VAALGLALLGLLAWVLFGNIERSLSSECVLALPGERYTIISDFMGSVIDVPVAVGDSVEVGQPIAVIKTPELTRHVAVARARLSTLEANSDEAPDGLALARAMLMDLETLDALGEVVVSPYSGEVTAYNLVQGQAVQVGVEVAEVWVGAKSELEAFAFVPPEGARELQVGMEAHVLTAASQVLGAQVREVSSHEVTPPSWLRDFGLTPSARSHLVRLSLRDAPPQYLADGEPCNLRVVLRRDSPARLLTSREFD
jgi:biotin carboxyl carrier protein